jgi:hypothetical protein
MIDQGNVLSLTGYWTSGCWGLLGEGKQTQEILLPFDVGFQLIASVIGQDLGYSWGSNNLNAAASQIEFSCRCVAMDLIDPLAGLWTTLLSFPRAHS